MLVYLNGEYIPREEAKVSVDDRGFLFGDGVYEVTRAVDGRLFLEEGHWLRLRNGLRDIGIRSANIDRGRIREVYEHLLRENGHDEGHATVYLQITRGSAPRNHAFPNPPVEPGIYAFTAPFTVPTEQRAAGARAITHPDIRWARCDIKSVNLLPNVVARQRAVEAGAYEAVFVRDGILLEGAATNLFGVVDGELRTYPKCNYILPGITREFLLGLARELGLPAREAPIYFDQVGALEELFVTGTTTDVQPIVELDGRPIGDGVVGRFARTLLDALMERMTAGAASPAG